VVTATAAETRDFYFNNQWRAVEERVSGAVMAQYVWNPADRWDLIRRRRSVAGTLDETRFVLRDYLDPAAIINPGGVVTERYRYDAFGPAAVLAPDFGARATSECAWNFLYHAESQDAETGLYNYGYRYYHPSLGRWISRDPIGEDGGLNLFGFVGNDAKNIIDLVGNGQVWTSSGIGNWKADKYHDYVAENLLNKGISSAHGEQSELGVGLHYLLGGWVGGPLSEEQLDGEAQRKARDARYCPSNSLCKKKICIVMVAPKT